MTTTAVEADPTLPVAPLVRFIEGRGGLKAQFPVQHKFCPRGKNGDGFIRESMAPEFVKTYQQQKDVLADAAATGEIPLSEADRIICETLNLHPFDVYGDAYFDLP